MAKGHRLILDRARRHALEQLVKPVGQGWDACVVLGRDIGVGRIDGSAPGADAEIILGQAEQHIEKEAVCRAEDGG